MTRLVIAGVPKSGKTTLANSFVRPVSRHSDDLIGARPWSWVSTEVATWFDAPGPWIIEGVAAVRALRKWLVAHPTGKPCDRVIWLDFPWFALTHGQATMAKGCRTIWDGVRPALVARGVHVEES